MTYHEKANETLDAEHVALAAAVFHQPAIIHGTVKQHGQIPFDPWTPEYNALVAALKLRGVMPQEQP